MSTGENELIFKYVLCVIKDLSDICVDFAGRKTHTTHLSTTYVFVFTSILSDIYESPEGSFEIQDSKFEIQYLKFEIRDSKFNI